MPDRLVHGAFVPALVVACASLGCASPATSVQEHAQAPGEIPQELLLDVGIAVFEASPPVLADDESAFRNAEVLRAERNYLPYVVGKHLQASDKWGAVRVLTRPSAAMDVTVTGSISLSDGETLAFRAQARDARGVVWFDNEYRSVADPEAYAAELKDDDPFADAYAAFARDMAESLGALSLDDLARIRKVTELAFARSMAPEAFAKHVTRTPDGGHELRRLPAEDDPMLQRVRDIRRREHLLIDTVNDYYDEFSVSIREPYGEWRREAYGARKAQRQLKVKADAHLLLGSSRIVAGLAHMDSDISGHLGFAWITHGLALIRGAERSEGEIEERDEWLRDVGSLTEATLLPHTIELENRTTRLQTSVEKRFRTLRSILDRLYREETGLPPRLAPDPNALPQPDAVSAASFRESEPAAESWLRPSEQTPQQRPRRILDSVATRPTAARFEPGKVDEAINALNQLLEDDVGGELVRNNTLKALGLLASEDGRAVAAFEHVVMTACETLCPSESVYGTERPRDRNATVGRGVLWVIWQAQEEIREGRPDVAIRMLSEVDKNKSIRRLGTRLKVAELATVYQVLAQAFLAKHDRDAAVDVYEKVLALGPRLPQWHREICLESLALIHFADRNYEQSLKYQREWLKLSPWVAKDCPKVCPAG